MRYSGSPREQAQREISTKSPTNLTYSNNVYCFSETNALKHHRPDIQHNSHKLGTLQLLQKILVGVIIFPMIETEIFPVVNLNENTFSNMVDGTITRTNSGSDDEDRMIDTGLSYNTPKSEPEISSPCSVSLADLAAASYIEEGDELNVPALEGRGPMSTKQLSRKPTVVRFQRRVGNGDDLSMSTSTDSIFLLDNTVTEDTEQLRYKLKELECELSAEKAIRRKKDASLVKLAKQLQKCVRESDGKDEAVLRFAKAVNELESQLEQQRREAADDQQKIRRICRETDDRVQEYDEIVLALKRQVAEAKLEVEMLNARVEMQQEIASMGSVGGDVESIAFRNRDVEIPVSKDAAPWIQKHHVLALALSGAAVAVGAGLSVRGTSRLR